MTRVHEEGLQILLMVLVVAMVEAEAEVEAKAEVEVLIEAMANLINMCKCALLWEHGSNKCLKINCLSFVDPASKLVGGDIVCIGSKVKHGTVLNSCFKTPVKELRSHMCPKDTELEVDIVAVSERNWRNYWKV